MGTGNVGGWGCRSPLYVYCMTMTKADVVEVLDWLGEGEVPVWLDGGWGVDALIGEQTRDHEDLDLIVRDDHVSRMSDVLHEHGFRLSSGVQGGFLLRDDRGAKSMFTRFDSTIERTATSKRTGRRSNIQPLPSQRRGTSPDAASPACLPKRR